MATGISPLTEVTLAEHERRPGALRCYAGEVRNWAAGLPAATSLPLPPPLRRRLLRLAGVQVGANVRGLRQCVIQSRQVSVGDGSFVNDGSWFEGEGGIEIGRDVFLGPQVMIITSTHAMDELGQVARMPSYKDVRIGDRCWLGARVTVMPGVTIGAGTVVGAGAVVTRDLDPDAVYLGVPARRVR
ncbi:MAG TPA: acyltransferase [Trebonia sp.]